MSHPASHIPAVPEHILTLAGVGKYFGSTKVLNDIGLQIAKGERLVICGPSGSGKSTLIRCVNGLETHDEGDIIVDGERMTGDPATLERIRHKCGMVFQHFNLFPHLTCLENCTLGQRHINGVRTREARERAMANLEWLGVADQAAKFPAQLSGGQQQRVAIARALCLEPTLLLFDEPTSALDPEAVGEVLDAMVELAERGVTMVCVTHELGFAKAVASKMAFMHAGCLVEVAPTEKFFNAPADERTRGFLIGSGYPPP